MQTCTFCDKSAVVKKVYKRIGTVYACNPCAVMLDDEVEWIGNAISEQELSTPCG